MRSFSRVLFSSLGGVFIAIVFLWMMQWLIFRENVEINASQDRPVMEFVRLKTESNTRTKQRELIKPEPPKQKPPAPMPPMVQMNVSQAALETPVVDLRIPETAFSMNGAYIGPIKQGAPDRDFMAISRMAPQYPYRAQRRGIEGWVKLSFLINEKGLVQDVIVVDAKPKNIFDQAAIESILKWKFKPRFENGKAVTARAEQLLEFQLKGN